ncbi:hypothetical protein KUD11_10340 [Roseovarius sp. LXJ103]|uniref:hypothetical protein n=1 Tax=Roseovarius carneus TaxID=2853164 RepID=UPI000D60AC1A|nr:hypothetical protein [Roseovarius carneus]MBZ8119045.1 hypothetical protein [Roseovarius carneus]PWE35306.1 hypothetical protein DD563_04615 [Pelagicola sp. LXJ1103]
MPRKSKKSVRSKGTGAAQATAAPATGLVTRRQLLGTWGLYGVGALAAVGGGVWLTRDFQSKLIEGQLTDIGNGIPTVLQIHDPQCSLCAQLQAQTRKALRQFDPASVQYRVADIGTAKGAAASAHYGTPHVTLVLICREGEVRHIVEGVTPATELAALFERHLRISA